MGEEKDRREIPSVDNDYDPYANRDVPHPTNDLESLAHITKGLLGTGVLAIPEGFSYAGGVMAIIYSLISGILCTAGIHILVTGFYMVSKAYRLPVVPYSEAMRLGFTLGPKKFAKYSGVIKNLVNYCLILCQLGSLCIYMLFVGVIVRTVTNNIVSKDIPLEVYLLSMVIPCLLINCLRNLKILAPVSYFSLAATIMSIALIYYYASRDGFPSYSEERKYTNDILKLPMFFGTTVYAFTSVAITVSIENNMKHPNNFHLLYNISMAFLVVLYLSVGFVSYWKWGEELEPVVILNFPHEENLARIANYLYALGIYLSLGLNGIVPVQLLMDNYILPKLETPHPILWEYIFRLGLIAFGLVLAVTVPHVGLIISLLGAITVSGLALIFPSLLDICWRYQKGYGKFKFRLVIDVLMICYGMLGLVTGVYVNIKELYEVMSSPILKRSAF